MSNSDEEIDVTIDTDLFKEPEGYLPPDKPPTFETHTCLNGESIKVRMVGQNPLWGHMLWNASRVTTNYIENKKDELVVGKSVLELGAGAGLPALLCAVRGASVVVLTDYPDPDLIDNIDYNVKNSISAPESTTVFVKGHIWGREPEELVNYLPLKDGKSQGFDLIILSDLIFNHSQHDALLATIKKTLSSSGKALVFFTPHRTWMLNDDLNFFEKAKENGFFVGKVCEEMVENPMFEVDKGPRDLRRTVFGYEVRFAKQD